MMSRHRLFMLAAVLVLGGVAASLRAQSLRSSTPQAAFVPANFRQITDSQGFIWDIQHGGYVNQGTNYAFSNAMTLMVNGNGFGAGNSSMSPDGSEYLMQQNMNGIDVTRRIRIDSKNAGCRWIDSFTNTGGAVQTVSVSYHTNFNSQIQMAISDRGRAGATSLDKKEGGILLVSHPNQNRPGAMFVLADPVSKAKPSFQLQNNRQFVITHAVKIDPGKTVSLCTVMGQRWTQTPPANEKDAAVMFRPFYSRPFIKDVPRPIQSTMVNWGGGGADDGERPSIWTVARDLGVEPGADDTLAIGEGTRLKGTASCESLSITTRYGTRQIDFAQVAAVAGPRFRGNDTQVYLRDGQLLTGQIKATGLRFALASGPRFDLDFAMLDRLVTRQPPDAAPPTAAGAIIETYEGDRLTLAGDAQLSLNVVTPWGGRGVAISDLRWLRTMTQGRAGFEAVLVDGSRFVCFLDATTFTVPTLLFGPQQFDTSQIKALVIEQAAAGSQAGDDERVLAPHVQLTDGQVLVGRVELESVPLFTLGGVIPVPPGQLRQMRNVTEDAPQVPGDSGVVFQADLWGGGTIVGRYQSAALPVRFGGAVWHVPARDVAEVVVPTPIVPEATYAKILRLVQDLGHPDWTTREDAQRQLTELGTMAAAPLREAANQSPDAEVRRRATAIMDQLD